MKKLILLLFNDGRTECNGRPRTIPMWGTVPAGELTPMAIWNVPVVGNDGEQ